MPLTIPKGESMLHKRAKARLREIVSTVKPRILVEEYQYPNPFSPDYPWRFDVYAELYNDRKIAIEVDGKIGHTSKRSFEKRQQKILYLKTQNIELYAFPPQWVVGKKMLPDSLFLDEMHLLDY